MPLFKVFRLVPSYRYRPKGKAPFGTPDSTPTVVGVFPKLFPLKLRLTPWLLYCPNGRGIPPFTLEDVWKLLLTPKGDPVLGLIQVLPL